LMGKGSQALWIASVENTATGEQRSFPSVETLVAFLRAEFGGCSSVAEGDSPGDPQVEGPPVAGEGERPSEHE
jgi:hypothetical protein